MLPKTIEDDLRYAAGWLPLILHRIFRRLGGVLLLKSSFYRRTLEKKLLVLERLSC